MATNPEFPAVPGYRFEGHQFEWAPFLGDENVLFAVVDIDTGHRTVDFVVKFAPNSKCPNHRHVAAFSSLVLEGDHRIYEIGDDGTTTVDIRPAGTFRRSGAGGVHREGGGPDGAVVWFNLRPDDDGLYEILDNDGNLIDAFGVKRLLQESAGGE